MKRKIFMAMTAAILLTANEGKIQAATEGKPEEIIEKTSIKTTDGLLSPELLQELGQVSDVSISPDGKKVLYGVTYTSVKRNKRNRELFTVNTDGSEKKQITRTDGNESEAKWIEGGKKIAFIYKDQLWIMDAEGTNRKKISDVKTGIEGFKFSPDEKKILFISEVKHSNLGRDRYNDLDQTSGKIIDDLMYKHWNEWTESIPHPFVADYDGNSLSNLTDILEGEPYECPMKPFGGTEQLSWSPDSKTIAYTCRKKTGKAYTLSTNSDIYLYKVEDKTTQNITEGMMGYDTNPAFSPDGEYIAWQSMERDGYESDKNRLFVMNLKTNQKRDLSRYFDYNTDAFCWDNQSKYLYIVACIHAETQLHRVDALKPAVDKPSSIKTLTSGQHDYTSVAFAGNKLVGIRQSMSSPGEVYTVDLKSGKEENISKENDDIMDRLHLGKVEPRWIKTTDGKEMLTWIIYPSNFDPNKKYPALLYCEGGPQSTVSQFWSTRWNFQIMAAMGYLVVAPNRRGLPSFGKEWNEEISGDYGGQNMKDYLTAIDTLASEPYVDASRLGCTGASYGGFSTYWLAGHHNKRFKAFFAHAGIFDLAAQYLETDELWFANWDLGGAPWEKGNRTTVQSYATSPSNFIDKWDTPIMISCGEKDYRILASQGMMAFNAAQLKNIPSRLLIYPDECHWILQPQNAVLFQREFFRWFDQWLKK